VSGGATKFYSGRIKLSHPRAQPNRQSPHPPPSRARSTATDRPIPESPPVIATLSCNLPEPR
jgi:hypothetical protein